MYWQRRIASTGVLPRQPVSPDFEAYAVGDAVERWRASVTGLAPETVAAYAAIVRRLAAHLGVSGPATMGRLDRHALRAFLGARGGQIGTRAAALSALRAFCGWAWRAGMLAEDPSQQLARPRIPVPFPTTLNVDDVARLLAAPPTTTVVGLRDRAVLEVLYATGLHARELVAVDLQDVDLDLRRDGLGTILTAGRALPLGRSAVAAVERYIRRRSELSPKCHALFIGLAGRRMGVVAARALVHRYGKAVGLGDVTAYTIRSSFAAHLLDGGADLRIVQGLLGHASIATTKRFCAAAIDHLVKVYDAAHPLARKPTARRG